MGLIRKTLSVSTLGGVKYTSRREAETKAHIASARLARTQARQLSEGTGKWEQILASIVAGEVSWDDLGKLDKLSMPATYQIRCRAASRRQQ